MGWEPHPARGATRIEARWAAALTLATLAVAAGMIAAPWWDGAMAPWFPVATIAARFWPGLPFVAVGYWLAARGTSERTRELRRLAITATLVVAALCLPARKVWNHALVAYPALALLAGVGIGPWIERRIGSQARAKVAGGALCALALGVWIAAALGLGRLWLRAPCIAPGPVDAALRRLEPGDDVLVVATPTEWRLVAALASERRLVPWPLNRLDQEVPAGASPRLALVREAGSQSSPRGWREVGRGQGWIALAPP